jgi:4-aminobutyrate aminotransferase-like enzyme
VLARHECPAITARRARRAAALGLATDDPIVWDEALGSNVRDVDGNIFVDLIAGFGVALLGHRDPDVVAAAQAQSGRLVHAMGDAFPDDTRIALLADLAAAAPAGLGRAILGLSGADAVDAAVKTAILATGRYGVLTFSGGYHGLSLGATGLQAYKSAFADPFRPVLHPRVTHAPYGGSLAPVRAILEQNDIGLVLVEPIQARGGCRAPPSGWLAELAALSRQHGALFAVDEIYAGLGRTGEPWACTDTEVTPDLLCTGKALGGGFPLSACLGTAAAMDAWGASTGEALHTQTFLGHPVGCAAARVVLQKLPSTSTLAGLVGNRLRAACTQRGWSVRGRGLLLGIELGSRSLAASRGLMARGWLALPAGISGEVLSLTPPITLTDAQIQAFTDDLAAVLEAL